MFYVFCYQVVLFYFSIATYNYLKIRKPHGLNIVKPPDKSSTDSPLISLPSWVQDWLERVAEAPAISKVKQIALQAHRIYFFMLDCFEATSLKRAHFPLCKVGLKYTCQNYAIL